VGQRTLPPRQPGAPRSGVDHARQTDADQLSEEQVNEQVRAAEAHAEYLHEYGEPGSDRRERIDAATREWLRHRELTEADPTTRTAEEPEPLGRRLPQPLDASREGVER
jgi:hypothetical protein